MRKAQSDSTTSLNGLGGFLPLQARRCLSWRSLAIGAAVAAAITLTACGQQPPSWDSLLAGKINGQYPDYRVSVTQPGHLLVERPGMPPQTVEVAPMALHCTRGPRDCGYAVEQMLLGLRDP